MRLTSVILHSTYDLEDIEFSLREHSNNRYIIRSIVGLDAEELIPKFYGFGTETGSPFYDRVMKPRDVVMRVALNPKYAINETVSDIRDELYRLISSTRTSQIQLQFNSGANTVSALNGMITKFEVPYFTQLPELQITVNCPDPTFRSIIPITYAPEDIPTSNPVILSDNMSTAHHGFNFKVKFTTDGVPHFEIQDHPTTPDWHFKIIPTTGFDEDDELWFSSEYGNKLVYFVPAVGPPIHLMDMVTSDSIWPTIFPGANTFHFSQLSVVDFLELNYYASYWGL